MRIFIGLVITILFVAFCNAKVITDIEKEVIDYINKTYGVCEYYMLNRLEYAIDCAINCEDFYISAIDRCKKSEFCPISYDEKGIEYFNGDRDKCLSVYVNYAKSHPYVFSLWDGDAGKKENLLYGSDFLTLDRNRKKFNICRFKEERGVYRHCT